MVNAVEKKNMLSHLVNESKLSGYVSEMNFAVQIYWIIKVAKMEKFKQLINYLKNDMELRCNFDELSHDLKLGRCLTIRKPTYLIFPLKLRDASVIIYRNKLNHEAYVIYNLENGLLTRNELIKEVENIVPNYSRNNVNGSGETKEICEIH